MTSKATVRADDTIQILAIGPDAYLWTNPYGGFWNSAPNWMDVTVGAVATSAPGAGNTVTIAGGINRDFTNIVGAGAAGQLTINNDVLLWGTVAVGGTATLGGSADLDIDGGASLAATTLNILSDASLEVGGGSTLKVSGTAALTSAFLAAMDGSTVRLGMLIANGINTGYALETGTIAVDGNSSVEVGASGGAALGAITIDTGLSAAIDGTIDGNLVVNGTLGVQAYGALTIDEDDPFGSATSITGSGTVTMSENSLLILGIADSAPIRFGAPDGTLDLNVLSCGTIGGFSSGDVIELAGSATALATGLSYRQNSQNVATLTLTKSGNTVGTLTLAGNYAGSQFHLGFDSGGDGVITLQTVGSAAAQPALILGTAGYDTLNATANNQTLTGLGGNDLLNAGTFTGIDFKDTSADMNGDTITSFGSSDVIDLTDMNPTRAIIDYTAGANLPDTLTVTDGTHNATITIGFSTGLAAGTFAASADTGVGTDVKFIVANTDAYSFDAVPGGIYGTASDWQDITTNSTATAGPSYGNDVTLSGGAAGYIDITGNGVAASVTTAADVLLWGTVVVGSVLAGVSGAFTQAGTLALDGEARLLLSGTASIGGLVEIGGGSTLTAAGGMYFTTDDAALLAIDGSEVRFPTLLGMTEPFGAIQYETSVIGVDPSSSIEFGSIGSAVAGALTIDNGMVAHLSGTIDANIVVNGTLSVVGTLAVDPFGSLAPTVSGTGTIDLTYGDTLALAGPDSVPIVFSQTAPASYSSVTETLMLGATMPTGMISGLVKGDVIAVGLTVTNLTWNGARLTLLDGGTTVGSLSLSGLYAANQFQVQPGANSGSSVITYAATPNTSNGGSVSGTSDSYTWNNTSGGVWSVASDWTDTTVGGTPTAAPGASNAVTIADSTGSWTPQIIYGPGAAASLTITSAAQTILIGVITVAGQFSVAEYGTPSGDVALDDETNLSASSLNVASLLRVTGASLLSVIGSSSGTTISGDLTVGSDSEVRVDGGETAISGTVAVDGTSSVEFGSTGTAAEGAITIDSNQAITLQGSATIAAKLVVDGSLLVYSATIGGFGGSAGSISGNGTITIGALGASGSLILDVSDTAAIDFEQYSTDGVGYAFESLELRDPLRAGTISGFLAGDTIIVDQNVTGAAFTQTSNTQGVLTLTDGATTVGTLTFAGNYTNSLFQVDMAPETGVTTISLQIAPSSAATAPDNTDSDAYSWTGASGGSWDVATNWRDTTTDTTPTSVASLDNVVLIAGSVTSDQYTTIGGNGAAVDFTVTGNVLLTGQVNVAGSVHVSTGSGPAAALAFEAGADLIAGGSAQVFGKLEFGGASSASIVGYALLYGGSLLVLNGSNVQAGGLIGDSAGDVLAVDASSVLKIGQSATGAAGAITVGATAPAEFNGLIYGSIVDNGLLWVSGGGTLFIDMTDLGESDPYESAPTIGGSGLLVLTEGSTLGLGVTDSASILFHGPDATLVLVAIPTAAISDFAAGDRIEVDRSVTGLTYQQVSASAATLTLTDGAATVGVLNLAGNYSDSNDAFHVDSAANGNTAVITLQSLLTTPPQMKLILGTVGADTLIATANGQTMTGNGGGDILSAGTFTGIDFKDYSAYLNGSAIQDFSPSDVIDFIDMNPSTASATYAAGVLSVTDGTHSAMLGLAFATPPSSGAFHIASDGAAGTKLTWS